MELLEGVEEEVTEFLAREDRPIWPNVPTACPVERCTELHVYNSYSTFMRHWTARHEPVVDLFTCPNCGKSFARRDNAAKHQRTRHKMTSTLTVSKVENSNYMDPQGARPFRICHRQRLATKRAATTSVGDLLVTEKADCRDEVILYSKEGTTTGKKFKQK